MKIYTIYKAINLINDKVYIGFTSSWPNRINGHNYDRKYGVTDHKPFYKAINKHGWENFIWEAIYQSKDLNHTLNEMEPHFIDEYRSWVGFSDCNGYNVTRGGEGTFGWVRSEKLIESHRALMKGRKQTPDHIQKRRDAMTGRSNEWALGENNPAKRPAVREKISQAMKGKLKSESHVAAMKLRPQDTTMLTCPHCNKTGDYKNMKRWHMDRCKLNSDRLNDLEKIVKCNICGYEAKQSPNFYRNHNEHCAHKKD